MRSRLLRFLSSPESVPLAVEQRGDGVPILLIHGVYGTGALWAPITDSLGTRFRVIAPDMRGHGNSGSNPGPLDAESVAADLIPTLDELGIATVHVLGHCLGGAAAQAFARMAPDRVRSLILVSAFTFQPLTWWERLGGIVAPAIVRLLGTKHIATITRHSRSAAGGRRLSAGAARHLAGQMSRNSARRMAVGFATARSFNSRYWLHELRMPTLVITGESDRMVSPRQSRLLAGGIPDARLETVAGAGHMIQLSHPDVFTLLVSDWFDEVEGRRLSTAFDVALMAGPDDPIDLVPVVAVSGVQ